MVEICLQPGSTGSWIISFLPFQFPWGRAPTLCHSRGSSGIQFISLPSDSLAPRGDSLSFLIQGEGSIYCSAVPSGSLVPVPTTSFQGACSSSFFHDSFSGNFQRQGVPSQPFRLFSSRVETIRWGLRRKVLSDSVIEKVIEFFREGTQKTYQSAWEKFSKLFASTEHSS